MILETLSYTYLLLQIVDLVFIFCNYSLITIFILHCRSQPKTINCVSRLVNNFIFSFVKILCTILLGGRHSGVLVHFILNSYFVFRAIYTPLRKFSYLYLANAILQATKTLFCYALEVPSTTFQTALRESSKSLLIIFSRVPQACWEAFFSQLFVYFCRTLNCLVRRRYSVSDLCIYGIFQNWK